MPPRVPRYQLDFLINGLQGGWVEPEQGAQQFLGFQDQAREARLARQAASMGSTEGLDALREAALGMSSDEAYQDPQQFSSRLQGIAQMYGLGGVPPGVEEGINSLYQSQSVALDDEDKEAIVQAVYMQRNAAGRAQIRDHISSGLIAQMGPEAYAQLKPEVDRLIDDAYAGSILPKF